MVARRRASEHAVNLVITNKARANRKQFLNGWKEFIAKPIKWLNDGNNFGVDVIELKLYFSKIPAQCLSPHQFSDAVIHDVATAMELPAACMESTGYDENALTVRLDLYHVNNPEDLVSQLRNQVSNHSGLLHSLPAGRALVEVEEINAPDRSYERSDEGFVPIAKTAPRGLQRSAPTPGPLQSGIEDEVGIITIENKVFPEMSAAPPQIRNLDKRSAAEDVPEDAVLDLNAHTVIGINKMQMLKRIHALCRQNASLQRLVKRYRLVKPTENGATQWCSVGINLTKEPPHVVVGEIMVRDEKGLQQDTPGYAGPNIFHGDRLISTGDWNLEHEPIDVIRCALRGNVNSAVDASSGEY